MDNGARQGIGRAAADAGRLLSPLEIRYEPGKSGYQKMPCCLNSWGCFCRCEFIRTANRLCANKFAPTTSSIAGFGMKLALGPVLYYWDRDTMLGFYDEMAAAPVDIIFLGETVCSRRHLLRLQDYLEIAQRLAAAGKEVVARSQDSPAGAA